MNYAGKFGSGALAPFSGADIGSGPLLSPHGHFPSHGKLHVDKVSTHAPSDAIIISDAHLLFSGDFKRSGVDLILSSADRELVLRDYFKGEKRAALASPDGAHLTGDIVNALSGHTQFAQADGSASVAPPVIGHVTKLTGNATAIRNGVSIILNQGETVHKGDVVQSGSDSTLGITFIDGSVFGLASNARMVLNEMVYDPNGSDNKSLLSLVQGTISFVAGATAKKGDMKVDTPVATMGIRGTAVLVEIDFEVPGSGIAPPAKFQVLVEPDGTTGSYILFDKTTLTPIATVNRAGTQTIVSGQGTVSFQSSVQLSPDAQKIISDVFSLKFTDLNNPNTKLTTNFTDSIVPETLFVKLAGGEFIPVTLQLLNIPSGTTPPVDPGPAPRLVHIPGPPLAAAHGGAVTERIDVTASSALDSISGVVNYIDVNVGDTPSVSTQFSSFIYQNAQGADVTATLTAQQLAAITAVEVPLSVVQDPNGKNIGTATWTYTIADGAFDFLAAGETLELTYMARVDNNFAPNNETTFVPFTIVITGTNDKPTISATGGEITERIGTGNTVIDTVSGTVTFGDVDLTDRPVVSVAISTTDPFRYYDAQGNDVTATLTPEQLAAILAVEVPLGVVQAPGNSNNGTATWTYSVEDNKFDFIAKGETLVLNYVAQVDDGHGGVITTSITVSIDGADVAVSGTNDIPTIEVTNAAFPELVNPSQPNPTGSPALHTVSGTISFTDVDLTDRPVASAAFASYTYQGAADASLTLTAGQLDAVDAALTVAQAAGNTNNGSASWTYSVPDSAFDFLADGEVLTLTYTATVNDGHGGIINKPLIVTVTGTNDTAVIASSPQSAAISEIADTSGSATPDHANGAITFTDVDWTDTHAVTITNVVATGTQTALIDYDTQFGWLSLGALTDSTGGATGSQSWTFSAPDHYFDYLADGEAITLTYTVQVDDHHGGVTTKDVVITVNGANDAPVVTTTNGTFTEMAGTGNAIMDHAGGSITFADFDLSNRPDVSASYASYTYKAADGTTDLLLTAQQQDDLGVALTLTPVLDNTNNGSVNWSYDVADSQFDFLAYGETLTLTYTAKVNDHHGGVVTKPVTVTITGTNDVPTLDAEIAGKLTDTAANDSFGNLTGTLTGHDVDHDETASLSYAALDGSSAVNTAVAGLYGSLTVNADGSYTYVPNAAAINALHEGSYTDMFTVQTADVHGTVSTAILTVEVNGTNDAPTFAGSNLASTYHAGDASVAVVGSVSASDIDSANYDGGTLTATVTAGGKQGDALSIVGNDYITLDNNTVMFDADGAGSGIAVAIGTLTDNINSLTIDLNTNANDMAVAKLTQAIGFQNTNTAPVAGERTVTFTLQDGGGTANDGQDTDSFTATVNVTANNHAATVGGDITGSVFEDENYTDASGHIVGNDVDQGVLTVEDVDSGESYFLPVDAAALIGTYGNFTFDEETGHWTYALVHDRVNGLAAGQIEYDTLTVTTADGTTQDITVEVNGTNDAPALGAQNLAATYAANGAAVAVVTNVSVSDVDSTTDYNGGSLIAWVQDGRRDGDILSIADSQYISLSGTTILFDADGSGNLADSIAIGTLSDSIDPAIDLNSAATNEAIAHLIQAIRFQSIAQDPEAGQRTVVFALTDGDGTDHHGQDTGLLYATVNVTAAPLILTDNLRIEEVGETTTVSGLSVSDADAIAAETFTVNVADGSDSSMTPSTVSGSLTDINTTLGNGLTYDPGLIPPAVTDMVTITVADGFGATDTVNFIFNEAGTGPNITLQGTDGKDVIFATGHTDTLTGRAGADQFVFRAGSGDDTITDFTPGLDRIDLHGQLPFVAGNADSFDAWIKNDALVEPLASGTLIHLEDGDHILLSGVGRASLHLNDFILHPSGGGQV
ncbi:VCBS domain-containing protein [Bradyrhizobium murdochi]|uniref:VCBS domain-containing protein n=1 Tax=Bradyrhizobium murdochi TaxID=1038859 RepID=UPI0004177302|nr:VCBS domain-containing protein [Bradyrhizobium murdochi]